MFHLNAQTIAGLAGLAVAFAVMYPSMLTKLSRGVLSPYARVDVRRRLYAATIDGLIVVSTCGLAFQLGSASLVVASAAYILLRDATGRSIGKFLLGLMVISLETGRPVSFSGSVARNLVFLIPGANITAAFLEALTIARDPQGQRLGDRIALTQVVDGFGVKQLAQAFEELLIDIATQFGMSGGRRRRAPVRTDRAA